MAGKEATTVEEGYLRALFDDLPLALTMQTMVYGHFRPGRNNLDIFGQQIVANAYEEREEFTPRLLVGATDLPV
jgi:hypothetical protein